MTNYPSSLNYEVDEVIKQYGIFVKTRNFQTGYGRTFSLVAQLYYSSSNIFTPPKKIASD